MHNVTDVITGATHQTFATLLTLSGRRRADPVVARHGDADAVIGAGVGVDPGRDRGAVSLEQVLWFVAAGISVAVIAGILWNQIADQAEQPITPPNAPVTGGG